MKDIRVSDLTMTDICNSPIYIRLGNRMRAPEGFHFSTVDGVSIRNVHVTDADSRYACLIAGVEGHPVRHVSIKNLYVQFRGGLTLLDVKEQRGRNPFFIPEARQPGQVGEANYPEPSAHGIQPFIWKQSFQMNVLSSISKTRRISVCSLPGYNVTVIFFS